MTSLGLKNGASWKLTVLARDDSGKETEFKATLRLDSAVEIEYYRNGGILHKFLRDSVKK